MDSYLTILKFWLTACLISEYSLKHFELTVCNQLTLSSNFKTTIIIVIINEDIKLSHCLKAKSTYVDPTMTDDWVEKYYLL